MAITQFDVQMLWDGVIMPLYPQLSLTPYTEQYKAVFAEGLLLPPSDPARRRARVAFNRILEDLGVHNPEPFLEISYARLAATNPTVASDPDYYKNLLRAAFGPKSEDISPEMRTEARAELDDVLDNEDSDVIRTAAGGEYDKSR